MMRRMSDHGAISGPFDVPRQSSVLTPIIAAHDHILPIPPKTNCLVLGDGLAFAYCAICFAVRLEDL
jgi:hypothetical protein